MVKYLPFAGTHILVSLSLYEQLQRGNSMCFVLTQRRQRMEWREKKKCRHLNMRGKWGIVIAKIGIENRGRSSQQNGAEDEEKN